MVTRCLENNCHIGFVKIQCNICLFFTCDWLSVAILGLWKYSAIHVSSLQVISFLWPYWVCENTMQYMCLLYRWLAFCGHIGFVKIQCNICLFFRGDWLSVAILGLWKYSAIYVSSLHVIGFLCPYCVCENTVQYMFLLYTWLAFCGHIGFWKCSAIYVSSLQVFSFLCSYLAGIFVPNFIEIEKLFLGAHAHVWSVFRLDVKPKGVNCRDSTVSEHWVNVVCHT